MTYDPYDVQTLHKMNSILITDAINRRDEFETFRGSKYMFKAGDEVLLEWCNVKFSLLALHPLFLEKAMNDSLKKMPIADRLLIEDQAAASAIPTVMAMEGAEVLRNPMTDMSMRGGLMITAQAKYPPAVHLMISEVNREKLASQHIISLGMMYITEAFLPYKQKIIYDEMVKMQSKNPALGEPSKIH